MGYICGDDGVLTRLSDCTGHTACVSLLPAQFSLISEKRQTNEAQQHMPKKCAESRIALQAHLGLGQRVNLNTVGLQSSRLQLREPNTCLHTESAHTLKWPATTC